jgi:hypothetical protein
MTENVGASKIEYVIGGQRLSDSDQEKAAQLLADDDIEEPPELRTAAERMKAAGIRPAA